MPRLFSLVGIHGSCVGSLGAKVYSTCVYFQARHASLNHGEVICIAIMGIMLLGRLIFTTFQFCMFMMMGWVASLACTVGQCSLFIECGSKKS